MFKDFPELNLNYIPLALWEVEGSSPRPDQHSQGLKITEDYICKWLEVQVFSDKDYKH